MLTFRELEFSSLYAGLGVQLIDEFASVPSENLDAGPIGKVTIDLDIDDAGTWRPLDMETVVQRRTASGVIWFPWLEHYRDATGLQPRKYRVRVSADAYVPRYAYDTEGVEVLVHPYDDSNPPATTPGAPTRIGLLPAQTYPFAPDVPVLNGVVLEAGVPVREALVSWVDAALQTDSVLSDADGEFRLPMRRAPDGNQPVDVEATTPSGGPSGVIIVRLPQDLPTFQTITIS